MKQYRLGVIGAGNMGSTIVDGAVAGGFFEPSQVLLFNRTEEKRAQKAAQGYAVTADYTAVYQQCQWVIFGIKPQNFAEILPVLGALEMTQAPLVISIAAAIPFAQMQAALGAHTRIVRAMPNTPLRLGYGATQLVGNAAATAQDMQAVQALFASMGSVSILQQEQALNDVIAYSGSFPAYVYLIADAMAQSAVQHGFAYEQALTLVSQTLIGAAKMMLEGEKTPQQLIDAVCSPAGTTMEAVQVLRARQLPEILAQANDACIARAYEIGKQYAP